MKKKIINFPDNFIWGTATSAIEIEGTSEGFENPYSLWEDHFDAFPPPAGFIRPECAADHINRLEEDTTLLKELAIPNYRFSLSWSRVIPDPQSHAPGKALDHYDRLTDSLLEKGIEPWVTLYAYDIPDYLQKEGGWINRESVSCFSDYADIVSRKLGDRVSKWVTMEDPFTELEEGYHNGLMPPAMHVPEKIYIAAHNMLIAHAKAQSIIRENAVESTTIFSVKVNSPRPRRLMTPFAKGIARAHIIRLFLDPILKGRYPGKIESHIFEQNGPNLRPGDMELISRTPDMIGLIHDGYMDISRRFFSDFLLYRQCSPKKKMQPSNHPTEMDSLKKVLKYIHERYDNPPLLITAASTSLSPDLEFGLADNPRIFYYRNYLATLEKRISHGQNILGFFAKSYLDGFTIGGDIGHRSGLVNVDFKTFKRELKLSARWYSEVVKSNGFTL